MLFVDIETADDSLVCVGWAIDDEPVQTSPSFPDRVRAILADADEVVVTHSGYDVRFLHFQEGAAINAQQHDTQVMAWLVNENTQLDLAWCAQRYLGVTLDKSLQKKAGTAPYADIAAYCAKDVETTRALYRYLKSRLMVEGLWDYFDGTEAPFTKVLRDMEFRGLPVDLAQNEQMAKVLREQAAKIHEQLVLGQPPGFNPRSPIQVSRFIASDTWVLPGKVSHEERLLDAALDVIAGEPLPQSPGTFVVEKEGRKWDHGFWVAKGLGYLGGHNAALPSVSRPDLMDNMQLANDPWVKSYLEYRKLDKLLGTYLDVFPAVARNGRIYGRFNQTGTATGRLSSSDPNLQNIPSRGALGSAVRDLFRGNLVVGDFSQLEPRLMAHFSQDRYMLDAFRNGRDLYMEIAQRVGCDRGVAKTLVLAMSYGAGPEKVASTLRLNGYPSITTGAARALLARLQTEYGTYFAWRERIIAESKRTGHVSTIDGRLRRLQSANKQAVWKDPSTPGRQAANAVVQGSAADIVRRVMLHTSKMFPNLHMLAQVHDEIVWEYDPAQGEPDLAALQKWVLQIAERGLTVPLVFEPHKGTSWYRAKEGIA